MRSRAPHIQQLLPVALCTCAFGMPASAQQSPKQPERAPMTPANVFEKVARAYAEFSSYRDSGTVKSVMILSGGTTIKESSFTTVFVRPDRLRFEYSDRRFGDKPAPYIIWFNGSDVRTWWFIKPGIQKPESLRMAIAAATGVTLGSAARVPGLLLPQRFLAGGLLMLQADRIDDDVDRGLACFRISGTNLPANTSLKLDRFEATILDSSITIWVDKKTFLVRRVESATTFDRFRNQETTTYTPEINVEIPEEALEFNPPVAP
jgi:outer membrane lipoprotein-sorting protein